MPNIRINSNQHISASNRTVEIVERKGIGHPDTICDALAEALSHSLCRYYMEHFGYILHHNVDKVLLWGGVSRPAFGGGEILKPIEIFLAGRASCEFDGQAVPIEELVQESSQQWLKQNLHALDSHLHVKLHTLVRPGSTDLVELFKQQHNTGIAYANDTSCCVGYAPLNDLETLVYKTEQYLNSTEIKIKHPEFGEDIKIMAVRQESSINLTIACAFIDKYISNKDDYIQKKTHLAQLVTEYALQNFNITLNLHVNAADIPEKNDLYLTVTGTSAESGDDGEVGRGNRVNGLITPYRPMNMEAAAGKNPVTHIGKLYNVLAKNVCESIVNNIDVVAEAQCYLVSRIGQSIQQPQIVDINLSLQPGIAVKEVELHVKEIVSQQLQQISQIQHQLLNDAIKIY